MITVLYDIVCLLSDGFFGWLYQDLGQKPLCACIYAHECVTPCVNAQSLGLKS